MAELLKDHLAFNNIINLADCIAEQARAQNIDFDINDYKKSLLLLSEAESGWESLTLMQRIKTAANSLYAVMPDCKGPDVVVATLRCHEQLSGWMSLVCCEYVAIHEKLTTEQSLECLKQITEYFSAEFAIRHLLIRQPREALEILESWLEDDNHHVRRLVSEGTRPRLPWGVRVPLFIKNPEWVLPLLLALRDDSSEYVGRSVANHLNDIAKDHREIVIKIAQDWLSEDSLQHLDKNQNKNRVKLIRHACRTLFKEGEPRIMALFGYLPADDIRCTLSCISPEAPFNGDFEFELLLEKSGDSENKVMVDYIVYFQKANGKQAPKVFKWLDRSYTGQLTEAVVKKHSFKKISTRKYYPGAHRIEVMVNGIKKDQIEFELLK